MSKLSEILLGILEREGSNMLSYLGLIIMFACMAHWDTVEPVQKFGTLICGALLVKINPKS